MLTQKKFIEVFNEEVGCIYEHSELFLDYGQNINTSSTVKEARDFAKILKEISEE
jgi:hypothetical protein